MKTERYLLLPDQILNHVVNDLIFDKKNDVNFCYHINKELITTVNKPIKIIISGGGTGGHIFPAIAIANSLKKMDSTIEILFIGAKDKMEMQKVPEAGYKIKGLWISGIHRRITFKNLLFPVKVIVSLIKSFSILNNFKPDVVVGVGGFASGPVLYMAAIKGIPTLIQEQNSYAGVTNRLLSKKVNKICVAYEHMNRFFPNDKIIISGNPVRENILKFKSNREEALKYFQLQSEKKTVLVIGGSLGARTINESIKEHFEEFVNSNIQLIWQTGKNYFTLALSTAKKHEDKGIKVLEFITRMDYAYAAADIIISRAGACTVSELCLIKKPVILVPSPNVAEDHQTQNAMSLVNKGAAIYVKDSEAKRELVSSALGLINNPDLQNKLSNNIEKLAINNSAEIIAKEVLALANIN